MAAAGLGAAGAGAAAGGFGAAAAGAAAGGFGAAGAAGVVGAAGGFGAAGAAGGTAAAGGCGATGAAGAAGTAGGFGAAGAAGAAGALGAAGGLGAAGTLAFGVSPALGMLFPVITESDYPTSSGALNLSRSGWPLDSHSPLAGSALEYCWRFSGILLTQTCRSKACVSVDIAEQYSTPESSSIPVWLYPD